MSRKIKYTKTFKIKAVEAIIEDNEGIMSICEELGVKRTDS